jgi:GNAT superfamily N-acetyltransferase
MPDSLRQLTIDDKEQVDLLCATIWEGHDYIPESFPKWATDNNDTTLGIFEENELVAICNLELVPRTNIAWVQGLRVKDGFRHKGYGTKIVRAVVQKAQERNVRTLWYVTSSNNDYSQKVAEKLEFYKADSVGYFRLQKPFPSHPRPSPNFIPMTVSPSRLFELLAVNPGMISGSTIPLAWEFDFKSLDGLERLGQHTEFKVVTDENGVPQGLFCLVDRRRQDEHTIACTVFSTDRAIFVDIISRIIDEAVNLNAGRAVFFLGPNPSEWAKDLGYVDEEFAGRKFLLYEKNPVDS